MDEIQRDFVEAIKENILNYIIRNKEEMNRLSLIGHVNCPIEYGKNHHEGKIIQKSTQFSFL